MLSKDLLFLMLSGGDDMLLPDINNQSYLNFTIVYNNSSSSVLPQDALVILIPSFKHDAGGSGFHASYSILINDQPITNLFKLSTTWDGHTLNHPVTSDIVVPLPKGTKITVQGNNAGSDRYPSKVSIYYFPLVKSGGGLKSYYCLLKTQSKVLLSVTGE